MKRRASLLALALVLVIAACGGDDGATVEGAWSRTNPLTETPGVVYFELTVPDDDRLVAASVPSDVAASAEIHEVVHLDAGGDTTEASDDDDMSGEMSDGDGSMDDTATSEGSHDMDDMDDMGGMATMREMSGGLALTGGETVTFEPGGYHVMLMGLAEPLEGGDEFELTLTFETAAPLTVTVEVADDAP